MADTRSALALLNSYVPQQAQDPIVNLLRALVEHAPTEAGRRNICDDILACRYGKSDTADPAKLLGLNQRYLTGLIIPSRDNYRSVISGQIDDISADHGIVLDIDPNDTYAFTEAAHISPFSLSEGKDADQVRPNANVWQLIERFSGIDLLLEFGGQDINRLGNVLTLSMQEHKGFGTLKWWLEAIEGQPNTYRVNARQSRSGLYGGGAVVTFTTTDKRFELPNPRYLAIHAACAKVATASGMAEYIDRVISDMEDLVVLREDGSSDVQLMFALHRIPVR
ncbi:hypothetical protein FRC10_009190 [Ceratobasidium sp. 414]|nr:hypothetical protein FRC10_009190 [Ceratobasidium sp. 414]